jgi:hypothetical protein
MEYQLSRLPPDLKASYDVIYEQLLAQGGPSQIIAHKAIAWLLCARQPISTLDFIQALNVGDGSPKIRTKEEVLAVCGNFVKHDEDLDRFRIFHLSVTNYFEEQRSDWPKELLNRVVADMCLGQCLSQHTGQRNSMSNRDNKTFEDYANVYWSYHCEHAGPNQKLGILEVKLEEKKHNFLLGGPRTSREFAMWHSTLPGSIARIDLDAKDIDSKQLKTKLDDSLSPYDANPPSRAFVACAFGFSEIVEDMLDNGTDFTVRTREFRLPPLYVAIRHDQGRVREVIRARIPENDSIYIRSTEIHAAVRTGKDAFVELLLRQRSENFITYGILEEAARQCNATTFKLLQSYVTSPMTQGDFWKEDLLAAAARNEDHGDKIVRLLLPEVQTCNEQVYSAAASNKNHGLPVFRWLLDKFKPTNIDHETVEAAARNQETGRAILRLIFDRFPDWKPDEEVIARSAATANFETFKTLLNSSSPVNITQEVFVAATGNQENGLELVELLLNYEVKLTDPNDVIIVAAGNEKSGLELVKLLLINNFEVSDIDNVIIAAMRNRESGYEIVIELLEHFQGVTSVAMEAATSMPSPNMRAFKKLLSLPLALDDTIIESGARHMTLGSEFMKLIRELRKDELATRSGLLAEALCRNYKIEAEILKDALRLAKNPSLVRDTLWNVDMFPIAELLNVFLDFIDPREELSWLVERVVANENCGLELINIIFTKISGVTITPEAIEIASQNEAYGDKIVEHLLDHDKEVAISIYAVLAAIKNRDKGRLVLDVLLPRFPGVVPLNEETTIACASNLAHVLDLMQILLE